MQVNFLDKLYFQNSHQEPTAIGKNSWAQQSWKNHEEGLIKEEMMTHLSKISTQNEKI
mgnify:CR=1 FL=1